MRNETRIMDHVRSVKRIFFDRQQAPRRGGSSQCFLFPAESGVDQPKDADCRAKIRLLLHDFFLVARIA